MKTVEQQASTKVNDKERELKSLRKQNECVARRVGVRIGDLCVVADTLDIGGVGVTRIFDFFLGAI